MKNKALLILLVTNFLLVSCTNTESNNETKTSSNTNNIESGINNTIINNNTESNYSSSDGVKVKIIKVDSTCIGCGICARIDPSHFEMNYNTHKAEAIQTNGNNGSLEQAINRCPVNAITVG